MSDVLATVVNCRFDVLISGSLWLTTPLVERPRQGPQTGLKPQQWRTQMFSSKIVRSLLLAGVVAGFVAADATTAKAGGFLGDIVERACGNCGLGRAGDALNHQLGNPVDHAGAAVLDAWVPGAGRALEGAWALQRSGVLNGIPSGPMGMPPQGGQMLSPGGFSEGGNGFPGPVLGNACATPVGVFYGPLNPVGMPCNANTPFGPAFGRVIRG